MNQKSDQTGPALSATNIPSSLGKYRIEKTIGRGAMGIVYLGYDEDIARQVALKVLHPHLLEGHAGDELLLRFKQEAQAAARCMHSKIVAVFDYGIHDGSPFIVMEYVEGTDLKSLLREVRILEYRQATDIAIEVLNALQYAHAQGVVHRDIKPANIMILQNGHVKVADFGVAHLDISELTQTGFMVGTPCYLAPEGLRGEQVDHRCDLYAMGVVLYEMITGKLAASGLQKLAELSENITAALDEPDVAQAFGKLISKALDPQTDRRYQSAEEFATSLKKIINCDRYYEPNTSELAATVLQTVKPRATSPRKTATGTTDTGYVSDSVVNELKTALTPYVGPMASMIVQKQIKTSSSIDALVDALITYIPNPEEQIQFRSTIDSSGITSIVQGTPAKPKLVTDASAAGGYELDDERQQAISHLLADSVGPLASRMVRRALRGANSWSKFSERLLDNIPTEAERNEFQQKLARLEPE
jgi:eukaryotic-like serine/threonine-protein kinase